MKILIVKDGALSDVGCNSLFAAALRAKCGDEIRLPWLADTSFSVAHLHRRDRVYSLDYRRDMLEGVSPRSGLAARSC